MLFPTTVTVLQICMKTATKSALCVEVRFAVFGITVFDKGIIINHNKNRANLH